MTQYGKHEATSARTTGGDATGTAVGADVTARMAGTEQVVRPTSETTPHHVGSIKTSAAAVFGLVFGLASLFCALTAILSPAALVFGILGIVLALVGRKMAKRPGVTGRGVALGGLITAVLGLLLGGAVLAGAAVLVNDERRLDQLQTEVDKLREKAPTTDEIRSELPS